MNKVCSRCRESKTSDCFYVDNRRGTLQAWCKTCMSARNPPDRKRERALAGFAGRFWSSVTKSGTAECWEWTGYKHRFGYGMISRAGQRSMLTAHRVSWELHKGPIPNGLHVLHKCDNPPCVNPAHLFLGTQSENNRDKETKGRGTRPPVRSGIANNKARLTPEKVREIRALYARDGHTMREIGKLYEVTLCPIQRLLAGETWRHVT